LCKGTIYFLIFPIMNEICRFMKDVEVGLLLTFALEIINIKKMMINKDLYQFTQSLDFMKFTLHQYLLDCSEPMLIATGTTQQAETIIPEIKNILGDRLLSSILVSHMESDECGGIFRIHELWPEAVVVCSEMTGRELYGFGYTGKIKTVKGGEILKGTDYELEAIDYPSEVHLQNGCLFFERKRGILYSADLMLSFGMAAGKVIEKNWEQAVGEIGIERIPNEVFLHEMKKRLLAIHPRFVAVGHGYCLKV
jgi:flavorubredoxin